VIKQVVGSLLRTICHSIEKLINWSSCYLRATARRGLRERQGRDAGSQVVFLVNGRFLVEVRSSGVCDLPLFHRIIENMNLTALPK